jgi:hypothetical protein
MHNNIVQQLMSLGRNLLSMQLQARTAWSVTRCCLRGTDCCRGVTEPGRAIFL